MAIVKKNLKALIAVFLGVFHFVLLAIPFVGIFAKGMGQSESRNVSGYQCFGEVVSALEAGGFMRFALIICLIAAIALLLIGLYHLLTSVFGDKVKLPDNFGPVSVEKLCGWVHMGYAGTSLLTLLAVIIVSISNTKTMEFLGNTATAGVSVGFGVILGVLLGVGSIVGIWAWNKKGNASDAGDVVTRTRFACSQCGETAKKGVSFCSKCGGQVVEIVPTKPMCVVCGTPAKKGDAFCSKCGGKIEEVAPTKPVCESCGAPAKNGTAFCPLCGGKIVQK